MITSKACNTIVQKRDPIIIYCNVINRTNANTLFTFNTVIFYAEISRYQMPISLVFLI